MTEAEQAKLALIVSNFSMLCVDGCDHILRQRGQPELTLDEIHAIGTQVGDRLKAAFEALELELLARR